LAYNIHTPGNYPEDNIQHYFMLLFTGRELLVKYRKLHLLVKIVMTVKYSL
jgi:hypothetical protein